VQAATQDLGTGTYTVMAQLAADALRMPLYRVRFELGDSRFPPAPVSGGSQTAASVGPAVLAAIDAAKQKLFALALADNRSPLAGAAANDLALEDGFIRMRDAPHRRVSLGGLLARNRLERFEATGSAAPGDEKQHYSMHSFGAQFVEVRIDPVLREIRVSRVVGAFAPGRILNAKTARSQAIGGIVFGIGMALLEATETDPNIGRVTNPNVAEYLMPVNADVPDIETIFVEEQDRLVNPVGVKGLGELPIVGVAAAIANAVWHATGVRVRDLPIRLDKILT
jgi:xanthine dehydrogenase YagR molybdenum-binding subunit